MQIDVNGEIIDNEQSNYILLGSKIVGHNMSNVPSMDMRPSIKTPLTSSPLRRLLLQLKIAMKHNFPQTLLMIAGSVMILHYSAVIKLNAGCPVIMPIRDR